MSDSQVWLAVAQALLFAAISLVIGTWVARRVGLLAAGAPAGETLGVGLASGLMVIAAWWAAVWSGGRSAFTPVAIGFAVTVILALARRRAPRAAAAAAARPRHRSTILMALASAVFIVGVVVLYGSTIAPSPRDGVQPIENNDEAFYAVLGRDLATTGIETNLSPSGFTDLPGLPAQTWYHWGELWLAAAVISISGAAPMAARYFIVLPVVLLAAAALTGTLVRRMSGTRSRLGYIFGVAACLFLAPLPLLVGSTPAGLVFEITLYGLGTVAVLLVLYALTVLRTRESTLALAAFVGSAAAFTLPAHIVIAALAMVGLAGVWSIRVVGSIRAGHPHVAVSPIWQRTLVVAGVLLVATLLWGAATGHGLVSGSSSTIGLFNAAWRDSVTFAVLGAGLFLLIPAAWILTRRTVPLQADFYLGTIVLLVVGAVAWGARLDDVTAFHLFFAGIAAFTVPAAAVAAWTVLERLRATGRRRLAAGLAVLCILQLEVGAVNGAVHLAAFGPADGEGIPVSLLAAIQELPPGAKLAYACGPFEEVSFADQHLLSIDAHTDRRVIPMCYEADTSGVFAGTPLSLQVPNPSFVWAPQRVLYPSASSDPSPTAITAFLRAHGIDYIYADDMHPNTLVPDATIVATSGDAAVLMLP